MILVLLCHPPQETKDKVSIYEVVDVKKRGIESSTAYGIFISPDI